MTEVPHFAFPFRIVGGKAAVVEQGTPEELEQNVKVLMLTQVGERLEAPDFGIDDPVFQTTIDTEAIIAAAATWDDRVDVLIDQDYDEVNSMVRRLRTQVNRQEG